MDVPDCAAVQTGVRTSSPAAGEVVLVFSGLPVLDADGNADFGAGV